MNPSIEYLLGWGLTLSERELLRELLEEYGFALPRMHDVSGPDDPELSRVGPRHPLLVGSDAAGSFLTWGASQDATDSLFLLPILLVRSASAEAATSAGTLAPFVQGVVTDDTPELLVTLMECPDFPLAAAAAENVPPQIAHTIWQAYHETLPTEALAGITFERADWNAEDSVPRRFLQSDGLFRSLFQSALGRRIRWEQQMHPRWDQKLVGVAEVSVETVRQKFQQWHRYERLQGIAFLMEGIRQGSMVPLVARSLMGATRSGTPLDGEVKDEPFSLESDTDPYIFRDLLESRQILWSLPHHRVAIQLIEGGNTLRFHLLTPPDETAGEHALLIRATVALEVQEADSSNQALWRKVGAADAGYVDFPLSEWRRLLQTASGTLKIVLTLAEEMSQREEGA